MRGLLIDPFQRKVHEIEVGNHIEDWHKWCDCELFDVARLGKIGTPGLEYDIWVDDEGLLREPNYPHFQWLRYYNELAGYGLLLCSNSSGESISTDLPLEIAQRAIVWEQWERRLDPKDYFEQLSRIYLPGSFGKGKSEI